MPVLAPRVLVADDDMTDLLVLRRLLRDTPYLVDTVRSASQAISALAQHSYAAVVTDDERLPDMPGALLLAEVERAQPPALRILLSRRERVALLAQGAQDARYQLIARPFFAKPLVASLVAHAARWQASSGEDTQRNIVPVPEPEAEAEGEPQSAEAPAAPAPGRLAYRRVLLTLAEMVEAKSGHASGHGARVSALARELAQEAGLSGDALDAVEDAALVHDVGELALDASLLREPRLLTDAERLAVRHHAASSFQIVRRAGLSPQVLDAVKHHHERWDGAGHPDGLAGDHIPMGARIIAVADTWDALATDRPYRPAMPEERRLGEFAHLAGSQLDPALVSLYVDRKLHALIDWSDPPRPGVKLL